MKVTCSTAWIAGASALAMAWTAHAQSSASADALEEVVVTGSRLEFNGNNSPTPVSVIAGDTMRNIQPTTLAEGLAMLPVFTGQRNQSSNPSATGAVGGGNGAANQLNLRGMGAFRNLILMDGRRVPPTLTTNIVDVDLVPEMLVQRVDVVTGGVSAVYGSDAVTGVVNYVIDRKFNGIKALAEYGVSEYGDGDTTKIGVAFGTGIGDRGHFEGSVSYYNDEGVLFRTDRKWWQQQNVVGTGAAASPYRMSTGERVAQTPFGGLIVGGPAALLGMNFKTDGVLSSFAKGEPTGSACCEIGGDGGYYDSNMRAPLQAKQFYARLDYDLLDGVRLFATAAGNMKSNQVFDNIPILSNIQLNSRNAFLSTDYQNQLAAAGATFRLSKLLSSAPRYAPQADADQYVFTAGLDGEFGSGWGWEVSYTRGVAEMETVLENNINNEKLSAALDAVRDSSNRVVCNTDISNPGLRPGCVPLNLFGPTAASAEAIDYILDDTTAFFNTKTHDVAAQLTGSPFALWAGPVNVALSAEWRQMSYEQHSNENTEVFANCAGLRYNCTQNTTRQWLSAFPNNPLVKQNVTEGAVEANMPLVKDVFSVTGAGRYTHYDTSGNYWTWKAGLDWNVHPSLRLRGTLSEDIRAPTLDDLFSPGGFSFQTQQDLLTGQSPTVPNFGGGNRNLRAEIGHTQTIGLVWRPGFVPGLALTLDAYRIEVTDAITDVQGFNPIIQRACYDSGGTSPYCQQQTRPNGFTDKSPTNAVTSWRGGTINIGSIKTEGADLEVNYSTQLFGRTSNLRVLTTWQPHIYYSQPALPTLDYGGVAFGPNGLLASPKWRVTGFFHIDLTDKFALDLAEKWRSSLRLSADETQSWIGNHVDAYATTNATVTYNTESHFGRTQVFFNVQNVFNKVPPGAAYFGNVSRPGERDGWVAGDNPVGRFYTIGVRIQH